MVQGQANSNIPRESGDQRGLNIISLAHEVLNGQTGKNEPSNPAASDDQSGRVFKRGRSPSIAHVVNDDFPMPAKQSCVTVEDSCTNTGLEVFD